LNAHITLHHPPLSSPSPPPTPHITPHTPTHPQPNTSAYLLIPITGVILGCSNLVGYFKCSKEAKKQLQSMGANFGAGLVSAAVQSRFQAAIARV